MGYAHINNLYKDSRIFDFKSCYALEKVHGSSANIRWRDNYLYFHSGGCEHQEFIKIFNLGELQDTFNLLFKDMEVVVYGEVYGGKIQGMSATYGINKKFIAFEVKIGDTWLNVKNAEDVVIKLGLEFVPYTLVNTTIEELNFQRELPSLVAIRRDCGGNKKREGIVCRPINEYLDNKGERVIVKYKQDEFRETKTPREINPEQLKKLTESKEIADEWVTQMRFNHVIDKFTEKHIIENTNKFCRFMQEDIIRESEGEIVVSNETRKAISKKAADLYVRYVKTKFMKGGKNNEKGSK